MSSSSSSSEQWMMEFNEATKLADDISNMISDRAEIAASQSRFQQKRYSATIRRKITILRTKLDGIQSFLLPKTTAANPILEGEMKQRNDMISSLREKVEEMASVMNMSNFGMCNCNWDSLLVKSDGDSIINQTVGLDNQGIVNLQRQIVKEQDEDLENLEETVNSTKHISLTINEELGLHTRLIDTLDQHAEGTSSSLLLLQKKLRKLSSIMADKYIVRISTAVIALLLVTIYFFKYYHT